MKRFFYLIAPSAFGDFGIVWQDTDTGPRLQRVLLSNIRPRLDDEIQKLFPGIGLSTTAVVEAISHQIQQFAVFDGLFCIIVGFEVLSISLRREFESRLLCDG